MFYRLCESPGQGMHSFWNLSIPFSASRFFTLVFLSKTLTWRKQQLVRRTQFDSFDKGTQWVMVGYNCVEYFFRCWRYFMGIIYIYTLCNCNCFWHCLTFLTSSLGPYSKVSVCVCVQKFSYGITHLPQASMISAVRYSRNLSQTQTLRRQCRQLSRNTRLDFNHIQFIDTNYIHTCNKQWLASTTVGSNSSWAPNCCFSLPLEMPADTDMFHE